MIKAINVKQHVPVDNGTLEILKDINLTIEPGQSIAIIGASGSGKSTLLGMLAGLDVPTGGEIFLGGTEITSLSEEERAAVRSQNVAFVFQNFQLLGSLNAIENVMLPLELRGDSEASSKAEQYLDRVGLQERRKHYPNTLSGGEQQRVAIARAFACEAPIIFADEPTGNLDSETGDKIAQLLFDLNKENGTTLVLVTHSAALADRCQKRFEMRAGSLTEVASK